jgi:hypothetical protein
VKRPKPQSAAECRQLIATEVVRPRLIPDRIDAFYRCLRMFERVEKQRRDDATLAALAEQNRLKAEEVDLRKQEYRRRAENAPNGVIVVNLRREIAGLKQRITELESGQSGHSNQKDGDCAA